MLDLLGAQVGTFGYQHRRNVLAEAFRAVQLGNQMNREDTLFSTEIAGDAYEIHVLVETTFEAERMDAETGVDHRADRRMFCGIKLLGQTCTLTGFS